MNKIMIFVCGLVFAATVLAAQSEKISWNFDSEKLGAVPEGFTTEAGMWGVVADDTAPSKPNVLTQLAKSTEPTFNLTLVKNSSFKDVDITVKMKAIRGRTDQGGGIVWRAKDAKNYYVARFNPLEDNYRLYRVVNGQRSEIKGSKAGSTPGWHTLRITMVGDHIECYLDGKKYLDTKDPTFKEAGNIGLWTKSDAQTHFDDLTVSSKP
jgi:hypothetical protein